MSEEGLTPIHDAWTAEVSCRQWTRLPLSAKSSCSRWPRACSACCTKLPASRLTAPSPDGAPHVSTPTDVRAPLTEHNGAAVQKHPHIEAEAAEWRPMLHDGRGQTALSLQTPFVLFKGLVTPAHTTERCSLPTCSTYWSVAADSQRVLCSTANYCAHLQLTPGTTTPRQAPISPRLTGDYTR